jgi:uncharacterized protein (TIGR02270 family)
MSPPVIESIVSRHAEEAAFLWLLRGRAVRAPHYSLAQLAELDERVEAHLDGLRVAGDFGWGLCRAGLEEGLPGDLFAAAVLAFESGADDRINLVLEKGPTAPRRVQAVVSALGWVPYERARGVIDRLAGAGPVPLRYAGIAAAAAHRRPLAFPLGRALRGDPWLDARIFRAIGELGATDVGTVILQGLKSADEACRFWAAWSGVLVCNEPAALDALLAFAEAAGPFAAMAAGTAARRLPSKAARRWVERLAAESRPLRTAVIAAGAAGDPGAVPWLMEQMKATPLARIAGEAFSRITGADLAAEHLDGPPPEKVETGPNDNPEDENVAMDEDDRLPWPHPDVVLAWWQANQKRFTPGTRYLLGRPITPDSLQHALVAGYQRQRAAAALELALLQPGRPLFEVRAPGFRQQQLLASGRKIG